MKQTPQEYAEKLIRSHANHILVYNRSLDIYETDDDAAKKSALIDVQNTIDELEKVHKPEYTSFILRYKSETEDAIVENGYDRLAFFEEVKQILEEKI